MCELEYVCILVLVLVIKSKEFSYHCIFKSQAAEPVPLGPC